jgi:hypothetical protein
LLVRSKKAINAFVRRTIENESEDLTVEEDIVCCWLLDAEEKWRKKTHFHIDGRPNLSKSLRINAWEST